MNHWLKIVHLVGAFAWMAALFYLPRLLLYHLENWDDDRIHQLFQKMERRLFFVIGVPAATVTWIAGFSMLWNADWTPLAHLWGWVKVVSALGLAVFHMLLYFHMVQIWNRSCRRSSLYFRLLNEVPTILLVCIVISAVIRF